MKNKVYIIQDPGKERDLSSAQRYGVLEYILTPNDKPSFLPGPCLYKLRKAFTNLTTEDYIVSLGGDPLGNVLAGIALGESTLPVINILRWERERDFNGERTGGGFYVPLHINKRPFKREVKEHEERRI
jgi:hypothetical protein